MVPFFVEIVTSSQTIYMPANHGYRIRYLRELRSTSQFQLEVNAKLAPGMLSRIENGKVNPTKETMWRVAKALNLALNECVYLFGLGALINHSTDLPGAVVAGGLGRYADDFLIDPHQMFDRTD